MTDTSFPTPNATGGVRQSLSDGLVVTWRNLKRIPRIPELAAFAILQSIMFVLLFAFVFGGAIPLPGGGSYREFLMPGIFAQTIAFAAATTAVDMTDDINKGIIDRFRSLPMARSAVLTGRTLADLTRNVFVTTLMVLVGFAVGFRVHTGALPFLFGMALVLLFGYALSWVFATVGLAVGDPETAQAAAFPVMAPLVFASSAFVPVETMPGWLQPFAEHQPVSVTASAVRALAIGGPTTSYVLQSLAWSVAILLVFAPIAVRRYRRAV